MSLNNNPEIAKLILVGQTSTGKTAIYNRIIFDTFNENSISTLSHSTSTREINVDGGVVTIDVWDTAGQERFRTLNKLYYKNAVFVLLIFSITEKKSFDNLSKYWIDEIQKHCPEYSIFALVGNKSDLFLSQEVTEEEQRQLAKKYQLLNFRISCKEGNGIEDMLTKLVKAYLPIKSKVELMKRGIKINDIQNVEKKPFCTWFKSKKKKEKKTTIKDNTNGRKTTIIDNIIGRRTTINNDINGRRTTINDDIIGRRTTINGDL